MAKTLEEYERELVALESTVKRAREKCAQFHSLNREMAAVRSETLQLEEEGKKELKQLMKDLKEQQEKIIKVGTSSNISTYEPLIKRGNVCAEKMEKVRLIRPLTGSLFLISILYKLYTTLHNTCIQVLLFKLQVSWTVWPC